MTSLQNEIYKAFKSMGEKSHFTDAILAKKLREITGIEGKNKAIIPLADIMEVLSELESEDIYYAVTVTNANDLLIEKSDAPKEISLENKQRRQKHEKSLSIFTNADLKKNNKSETSKKGSRKQGKFEKRTSRSSININSCFEEAD